MRAALLLPLALLACSERNAEPALSNEQVARQVAQLRFQPGSWETRTEVRSVEVPGAPADLVEGALGRTGQTQVTRSCLSAAQAANPDAGFLAGNAQGNCRAERLNMDGGRIDGRFVCRPQGLPGTATADIAGTYTRTAFRSDVRSRIDLTGLPDVSLAVTVTSRRVGACPGAA